MASRVKTSDWNIEEGVIIFHSEEGQSVSVPIRALPILAAHARRFLSGASIRAAGAPDVGGYHYSQLCTAATYNIGLLPTSTGEKVALILDQGQESEIGFAIEPEHARELGVELQETASRASSSPVTKN
ncbi:MAG: hypothetical protein ACR65U_03150 [Methylocystis sp.]